MTFASPNHHSSATGFPCAASRVSVGKSSRVVATLTSNRSAGKVASVPEVKQAYKQRCMEWHPDRHANSSDEDKEKAEVNFKLLGEALEVMEDTMKRQLYDEGFDKEAIAERVEAARRARAMGMGVLGVSRSGVAREGADEMHGPEALHELLPRADVLSIHVPLTPETRGRIGVEELALLPEGALVLNAARGAVLSEGGLLGALEQNVAGAWLDVFEQEPLPEVNPLWHHPRILLSPHCADQVEDFPARFAARFRDLWLASR